MPCAKLKCALAIDCIPKKHLNRLGGAWNTRVNYRKRRSRTCPFSSRKCNRIEPRAEKWSQFFPTRFSRMGVDTIMSSNERCRYQSEITSGKHRFRHASMIVELLSLLQCTWYAVSCFHGSECAIVVGCFFAVRHVDRNLKTGDDGRGTTRVSWALSSRRGGSNYERYKQTRKTNTPTNENTK